MQRLQAGLILRMPITHFYGEKLLEAVREGEVTEQTIDESALRIIRTLLAHEHFIEEHKKKEVVITESIRNLP